MADRQIKQLTEETSVQSGDWYLIQKASNDETVKVAASNINPSQGVSSANIDFGGAGTGIWWEEIGRTTLTVAGDVITVSGLSAKKYLKVFISATATGGTLDSGITLNNNTSANYSYRIFANAAGSTGTSATTIPLDASTIASGQSEFIEVSIFNPAAIQKILTGTGISVATAGAATAPGQIVISGTWVNASQISRIDVTNTGTGDFAIGSEIVVLGHN